MVGRCTPDPLPHPLQPPFLRSRSAPASALHLLAHSLLLVAAVAAEEVVLPEEVEEAVAVVQADAHSFIDEGFGSILIA